MHPAFVHLALNHVPVVGIPVALAFLLYGWLRRQPDVVDAGLVVFALIALLSWPVYLSGEGAARQVDTIQGVARVAIDAHIAAALFGMGAIQVLGVLSLLFWRWRRETPMPGWERIAVTVVAAVTVVLLCRVAWLGERVHHGEFAGPAAASAAPVDGPLRAIKP